MQSEFMKKRAEAQKVQAAKFKTAGYTWKKRETVDSYDPDEPKYESYLVAPDGIEVTIAQANDEIERGRDVVRAEIATQEAERQERNRIAQAANDEAKKREQETTEFLLVKIEEIKAASTETEFVEATWEVVHVVEAAGKKRMFDGIWKTTIGNKTYYKMIVGSYLGDTIEATYRVENAPEAAAPTEHFYTTKPDSTPAEENKRFHALMDKMDKWEAAGLDQWGLPPVRWDIIR